MDDRENVRFCILVDAGLGPRNDHGTSQVGQPAVFRMHHTVGATEVLIWRQSMP